MPETLFLVTVKVSKYLEVLSVPQFTFCLRLKSVCDVFGSRLLLSAVSLS